MKKMKVLAAFAALSSVAFAETVPELQKAFNEAVAAGHPLRADRAFVQLLEKGAKLTPLQYRQAAEVSRQLGKGAERNTRLAHYLKVEEKWDGEVTRLAYELCFSSRNADAFVLLASKKPSPRQFFSKGIWLLRQYVEGRRAADLKKVAEALLALYKDGDSRNQVYRQVCDIVFSNAPGISVDDVRSMLERFPCDKCDDSIDRLLSGRRDSFSPLWRLKYMAKNPGCILAPRAFGEINYISDKKYEGERDEAAKLISKIQPVVLDGKHASQALSLFYVKLHLRGNLYPKGKEKERSADFRSFIETYIAKHKSLPAHRFTEIFRVAVQNGVFTSEDGARLRNAYPSYMPMEYIGNQSASIELASVCRKASSLKPFHDYLARIPAESTYLRYAARLSMLEVLGELKSKNDIKQVLEYCLSSVNENIDWNRLVKAFPASGMTDAELAEYFASVYKRYGYHRFWDALAMSKEKGVNGEKVRAFVKGVSKSAAPADALLAIARKMASLRRGHNNVAPSEAHELFKQACKHYKGFYPTGSKKDNALFGSILGRYSDLSQHSHASAPIALKAIIDKLDPKNPDIWKKVVRYESPVAPWLLRNARTNEKIRNEALVAYFNSGAGSTEIGELRFPKNTDSIPIRKEMWKNDIVGMAIILDRNWHVWNANDSKFTPRLAAEIAKFCLGEFHYKISPKAGWLDTWWRDSFMRVVESVYRAAPAEFAKFNFDAVAAKIMDGTPENDEMALRYLALCGTTGRAKSVYERFVKSIASRPAYDKINLLVRIANNEAASPFGSDKDRSTDVFSVLMKRDFIPALKALPTTYAPLVDFGYEGKPFRRLEEWSRKFSPNDWTDRGALSRETVRLLSAGASGYTHEGGTVGAVPFANVYNNCLFSSNAVGLVSIARDTGRRATLRYLGYEHLESLVNKTMKQERWEALYLLTSAIQDGDKRVQSLVAKSRALASKHLPGVYPVSERDPLYPLYVAADELQRNNVERATALLMKNLTVFERDAMSLPPDFTAWAVDQMRMSRGKNDTLLLKARSLASRLLQDESRISPELAASLVLVRAECYRDQQNFEVAKLEYQTIRNSPVYSKTKSGRKAMFRFVDLMIEMGNSTSIEPTLEYWLSQPDIEIQAQAHYFLARIAFDRKDYDECRKQLKEVFAINFTHTEGRFLEGRWKLATGNEVDDTEVMIGNLSDRTMIRPGQQLAITVQDRNLSVAGGGASIPVVITTEPGGDRERIYLYPTPRDPTLFRGFIDVKLAETVSSNLTLEVSGKDIASYNIDKEFLEARGLPVPPPKRLRVVDNARLIVGTGSPRTDDEEEKEGVKSIEEIIDSADLSSYRSPSLRPGNPLYIAIMDKDRSNGGDDSVSVKVSTSSGDILDNVSMKEIRPYSGIFRGEIPTSLPPPRAFSSDTAVGFNPGDVISTVRNGGWKSLSDGKRGKWFSVDTMGSHLFSNIVIKSSSAEEVRRLRLTGKIGGDQVELALFPAPKAEGRSGLRRWAGNAHNIRGEHAVRTFIGSAKDIKPQVVTNITASGVSNRHGAHVTYSKGAFVVDSENEHLRLRITPLKTGAVMTRLWLSVVIDGKPFFSGFGPTLANHVISRRVSRGCHTIEVFSVQQLATDAWELSWCPSGGDASPVPAAWFDAKEHPEIDEFLADKASISRTEDGFLVTFRNPTRLRSFTFDFLEHIAPGVALDKISACDWDGKAILPVGTDFSDAQRNSTLEVAPGDTISVSYVDKVTTSGKQKIATRTIRSSFNDANLSFYFEHVAVGQHGVRRFYNSAYRFVPGDTILVGVTDRDLDVSDEADKVDVVVQTADGEKRTLTLLEQDGNLSGMGGELIKHHDDVEGIHSGFFLGLLPTRTPDQTNAAVRAAYPCSPDEVLKVSYIDRENTRPGVPYVRTATVTATKDCDSDLTLFHSRNVRVEDTSRTAKARLAALRRRAGNEMVEKLYKNEVIAVPMSRECLASTGAIPVNVSAPLLVRVKNPSQARHNRSYLVLEAVTSSEIARAEVDGDEPDVKRTKIALGAPFDRFMEPVRLRGGFESEAEALAAGSFNGAIRFSMGEIDPSEIGSISEDVAEYLPISIPVNGYDKVYITVKTAKGDELLKKELCFVSDATMSLVDSSWTAERDAVHVGEHFYVKIEDADRDKTDEPDTLEVDVETTYGTRRKVILTETLPHSGVFAGTVRPSIFPPSETIPEVATGAVASAEEILADDRVPVKFGEGVIVRYTDSVVLPGSSAATLAVTGTVYKGANGSIRLFSKRFRDADEAVLVQFRLAECLFEQAKDFRKLKHMEKSAEAIVKGRTILEEALKNNPQSSHVAQGEFLLANLYQELAAEEEVQAKALREEGDDEAAEEASKKSRLLYAEALARFSSILAVWPEGEYAPRSQYHKAYCLEMLKDYKLAGEEYVKMTYMYPESDLVGDATIRLATYYFREEKKYSTAARIYESFARRFPNHDKAARSLFMCGSCYIKEGEVIVEKERERLRKIAEKQNKPFRFQGTPLAAVEMFTRAVNAFVDMAEKYSAVTSPELRAQGLYWAGDASLRKEDVKSAYIFLKRAILEYPETEWARRARGLMLQNGKMFKHIDS